MQLMQLMQYSCKETKKTGKMIISQLYQFFAIKSFVLLVQAGLISKLQEKGFEVVDHGDISQPRIDGNI